MDKSFALIAAALITIPIGIGTVLAQTEDTDQATPNLAPTGLERSPADPGTGENVTLTATVINDGNASASNFIVQFFLDGDQLGGNISVVGLDANESTEISSETWNATEGDHNATVIVDAGDDVNESNEADNELTVAFTVEGEQTEDPGQADLIAGEPSLDPTDPAPGDNVTFTATVSNGGNASAGNFTVQFLLDGEQLGENITIEGLAANESIEITSEAWNASEGDHNVTVVVDAGDAVNESDESNNEATTSFTVEASSEEPPEEGTQADLIAEALSVDPSDPEPGENVTFRANVSNVGNASAGNFTVQFLLDGEQLGENITIEGLAANESIEITSEAWNASEGDHNVTVVPDAGDDVDESDESNNEATTSFTVEAPPEHGDEGDEGKDQEAEQVTICHRPPGNPDNEHTITIGEPAWQAHEGHGDHKGACEEDGDHEERDDNETSTSGHDDGNASAEQEGNETGSSENDGDQAEESENEDRRGPPDHAKADGRRGR